MGSCSTSRPGRGPSPPIRPSHACSPRRWFASATTRASTTRALITAMDVPLGLAVGNALEVSESVDVLAGGGPADVVEITVLFAREMLDLAGIRDVDPAETLRERLGHGRLEAHGACAGRRPGCARCRPLARTRSCMPRPTGSSRRWMPWASAWPPGGSGPGGPVSRTLSRAGAGILLHAKPGDVGGGRRPPDDALHRRRGALRGSPRGAGGCRADRARRYPHL